jgi:CBS domain-containing protein
MHAAAQLMWDHDCGAVPVVDRATGRLAGIVTDRDMCMAALLSNRPPHTIPVREVMSREVRTCQEDDELRTVHARMREHRIRRLPVVDQDTHLIGVVSLNALAAEAFAGRSAAAAKRQREVAKTLGAVCERPYEADGAEAF